MYEMRDIDAYWMNWCWSAWRSQDSAPSNLTGSNDGIARAFFTSMNQTFPINKVSACSNIVFPSIPSPTQALSPVPDVFFGLPPRSANYGCLGQVMQSATLWLGISGGIIMIIFMIQGVRASILWGILWVTFISWIRESCLSLLPCLYG
jgi:hypothetical protein